jgi:hypothetical protein
MTPSDERMDAIAERIGSALADEDVLESAVVLGDILANMICRLDPAARQAAAAGRAFCESSQTGGALTR